MAKKSKKFLAAQAQVPEEPIAPLAAMNLLKEISSANFDETVEAHFRLGIDTRQADQQLRGTVSLPNGSGKSVRVAVFAEGEAARVAEEAGADIVGTEELIAQVQAGEFNFDAAVATPDQMGKVGRLGSPSAPAALCRTPNSAPSPMTLRRPSKSSRAVAWSIARIVTASPTSPSARSSMPRSSAENYGAVYDEIIRMKPSAAKGKYVKSVNVASTMSPAVKVDSGVTRAYTEAAE